MVVEEEPVSSTQTLNDFMASPGATLVSTSVGTFTKLSIESWKCDIFHKVFYTSRLLSFSIWFSGKLSAGEFILVKEEKVSFRLERSIFFWMQNYKEQKDKAFISTGYLV